MIADQKNPSAPTFGEIASMTESELLASLFDAEAEIERLAGAISATDQMGRDSSRLRGVVEYWVVAHKRITARLDALDIIELIGVTRQYITLTDDEGADQSTVDAVERRMVELSDSPAVKRLLSIPIPKENDAALSDAKSQTPTDIVGRIAHGQRTALDLISA